MQANMFYSLLHLLSIGDQFDFLDSWGINSASLVMKAKVNTH